MQKTIFSSLEYQKNSFSTVKYIFGLIALPFFIVSCGVQFTPVETFEEQNKDRHLKTEEFLKEKYPIHDYNSLAFGKTIVYKPESFRILDSLYAVKQDYIDKNKLRELKTSGIEDMISQYRPKAQADIDQVKYEHEHIYTLNNVDSMQVNHDYFVFDFKDSLITHTPFYNYNISSKWKKLHNSYLFEFHFVTNRDLYISGREREFIAFFKAREEKLIGEPELQPFMNHTFNIMEYAQAINSVDFNAITKQIGITVIKFLSENSEIESFGTFIALEDEYENVIGYERTIKWLENNKVNETTITFSPYLEFEEMKTKTKDKLK